MIIGDMVYMPYNTITGRNMTEFTVIAYEKEDGESPIEDFINGLDVKMRAKMYGLLSIGYRISSEIQYPYLTRRSACRSACPAECGISE